MSHSKTTDGPCRADLQATSRALREIANESDRVTLAELLREMGLDDATVE